MAELPSDAQRPSRGEAEAEQAGRETAPSMQPEADAWPEDGRRAEADEAPPEDEQADEDEARRVRTLDGYNVLRSPPTEEFDRITSLAVRLFDVPIAMINFIDRDDQWCVSGHGLSMDQMPREIAFCTHALGDQDVMVVTDVAEDPRFKDNPLVADDPHIRFYAGAPLEAPNGYLLGAFCLVDTEPHASFSERDQEALQELAGIVMDELNLRHYAHDLGSNLQAQEDAAAPAIQILESITDAFFALDDDWNFTYVNAQAETLLERSRADLVGRNVWDEFEDAVGSTFYDKYHRAVRQQETVEFLEHYPPLERWFEVTAFPFFGGLSVYFDDVTERVEAQENLRRERDLTEAIIDTSIAAIVTVDADGTVTFANDCAADLLGASGDDLVGADYFAAGPIYTLDGEEIPREDWPFNQIMQTGEPVEGQRFMIHRDDAERRIMSSYGAPLRTPEGEIRQVVFSMVDLTEHTRLNEQLRAAKDEAEAAQRRAEAANQSKSRFLAGVAHDLRNPLSGILGLAHVLQQDLEPPHAEMAAAIVRSGKQVEAMANHLVELSRLEAGQLHLDLTPGDVRSVVQEAVQALREEAREAEVELHVDVPPNPARAPMEEDCLRRVLDNLIGNAIAYGGAGSHVTAWVACARPTTNPPASAGETASGEPVVIGVDDTGPGIAPDFLEHLFEPFARDVPEPEGMGLGLAVAKGLVEAMGGTLSVASEPSEGTWFRVVLPGGEPDAAAARDADADNDA